jgi:hypothetical protein
MKFRWLLAITVYALLIGGGWLLGQQLSAWSLIDVRPINEPEIHRVVMAVSAVYVAASALPFVPGAEIGLALIAVFGGRIVFLVYFSMVLALVLAYLVGRFIPIQILATLFAFVGLHRAHELVHAFADVDEIDRVGLLVQNAPGKWGPFLVRNRYIALAVAFNVPGNSLVGGGGGLGLLAGMSGVFAFIPYCLTVGLAISPIPLLILLTGYQI